MMPERLQQEVWRKSRLLEQAERMARIGAWELDVASGALSLSEEACRIYDVEAGSVLDAEAVATFFPLSDLDARVDLCKSVIESGQGIETQGEILSARGSRKWAHRIIEPELHDGKVVRLFGIVRDLTEGREHEETLWRAAHYDALTKVPNRHYWTVRLDQAVARATQNASGLTMLMFDLDGFKEINDTRGHATGDAVLVLLGQRLGETLPPNTFHARLGGDEFAVLLDRPCSIVEIETLVRDILVAIQKPMIVGALRLQISGTFGSAQFPADAKTAADLMRKADIALYQAKRSHRSSFVSFRSEIGDLFNEKRAAIDLLAGAIDRQRLVPFYQPKIDMKTGKRVGFEALCRIVEEDGTIIGPPNFLPALQDPASCARLGAVMLELVTQDLADWLGADFKPGRVALNVTSADFAKAPLHERIIARLASLELPASCLEVEVTENTILGKEAGMVSEALQAMRTAGIAIALDDFGTGYASLTHLRDAPITCLKLDRSFVGGLARGAESAIIIRSIIDLGHSLGMRVVAEGVETSGQAEFLRAVGCDHAQGFLFGRPTPRDLVRAQLRNEATREGHKRPLDFTKTGTHDRIVRRAKG